MASRRAFTYVLAASGGVVAATTAKHMVNDFLETMSMAVRGVARCGGRARSLLHLGDGLVSLIGGAVCFPAHWGAAGRREGDGAARGRA